MAVNENECDRILDSFFGGAQRVFDYRICSGGTALRAYPWAPHRFVHLEVTTEKLESSPAWQFGYVGTGYSVHLNCRHSDIDLQLLLARGLESRLRTIKKHLGQDIYVPGRYRQSRDEVFLVEDMCRIPHSDDAPTLVGCRMAQYALALRTPVDELLHEAGYPTSSASKYETPQTAKSGLSGSIGSNGPRQPHVRTNSQPSSDHNCFRS